MERKAKGPDRITRKLTLGTRIDFRSKVVLTVGSMALCMLFAFPFLPPQIAGIANVTFVVVSTVLGYRKWGLVATLFTLFITWVMDLLFWNIGFPPSTYIVGGTFNLVIAMIFGTVLDRKNRNMMTDGLTQLLNHVHFHELLAWEVERSQRYGRQLSLLMIDLDNFKELNDTHGHQLGDQVLVRFSAILRDCARKVDVVARYGGDEFAIVMPETDAESALNVGRRICRAVAQTTLNHRNHSIPMTVSIGGTELASGESKDQLIGKADSAMYLAKRRGKNSIVVEHHGQFSEDAEE